MTKIKNNTTSLETILNTVKALLPMKVLQASKTFMPSNTQQTITPDEGYDGIASFTLQTDEDLKAENIMEGIEIFGVAGTATGESYTITVTAEEGSTVSATNGTKTFTGTVVDGTCTLVVDAAGTWNITATTPSNETKNSSIEVGVYTAELEYWVPLEVSFSGTIGNTVDNGDYRYYTITESGTITLNRPANFEYWICGGGASGGTGYYNSTSANRTGGGGGGGGYFTQGSDLTNTEYIISIGTASSASTIQIGDETITAAAGTVGNRYTSSKNGGAGGAGGSGGGGGYGSTSKGTAGTGGGLTTVPFGENSLFTPYCAGGNGGYRSTTSSYLGYQGGSDGSNGTTTQSNTAAVTGGGLAHSAATGYGGGGGGGCGSSSSYTSAGAGYQGVCFLRIPLSEFGLDSAPEASPSSINFTIDLYGAGVTTFSADQNMTWRDWIDSDYNTRNLLIGNGSYIIINSSLPYYLELNSVAVNPDDLIVANAAYTLK